MLYTRRELAKLAVAAVPAARLVPGLSPLFAADKPNSKFAGVQVGLNVPYNFGNNNMDGDEVLARVLRLGVNALELRSQPIEAFLGAPSLAGKRGADLEKAREELRAWRTTADASKAAAFRKKYNDAGVQIEIVKFDGPNTMTDAELDYAFTLAKTVGARALSCEMDAEKTERLGAFADKHTLMVGYHLHTAGTPAMWEKAFSQSKYNGANVDLGHYIAGLNTSPIPFIEKHHDRITHVHVKDRKFNNGPNVPFGQGDTPIKETLRLLRDKKWPIQATIEFEYPVPEGSDRMAEMTKCIEFCKAALG